MKATKWHRNSAISRTFPAAVVSRDGSLTTMCTNSCEFRLTNTRSLLAFFSFKQLFIQSITPCIFRRKKKENKRKTAIPSADSDRNKTDASCILHACSPILRDDASSFLMRVAICREKRKEKFECTFRIKFLHAIEITIKRQM
jgi:hypothetical protein